jgi:hypothetical protein
MFHQTSSRPEDSQPKCALSTTEHSGGLLVGQTVPGDKQKGLLVRFAQSGQGFKPTVTEVPARCGRGPATIPGRNRPRNAFLDRSLTVA